MIKSLSVVLAYLFFLSSAYYLTFYGTFNIDIFQYLTAEDMVKGVLYPLKYSIYFLVFIFFALLISLIPESNTHKDSTWINQVYQRARIYFGINVSLFISVILGVISYWYLQKDNPETIANLECTVISVAICIAMIATMIYWSINNKYRNENSTEQDGESTVSADKENVVKNTIEQATKQKEASGILLLVDYMVIGVAFYLLASALGFGILNAKKIKDSIEYDYVVGKEVKADSLKLNPIEAVYLGAVGDKYLFSDKKELGTHYVVIDKAKLPVLSIRHCSNLPQGDGITEFSKILIVLICIIGGIMLVTESVLWSYRRFRRVATTKTAHQGKSP